MSSLVIKATKTEIFIETLRFTSLFSTTIPATPGQNITLFPCSPTPSAPLSTASAPVANPTETITITEFEIFLEGPGGDVWTTLTFDATYAINSVGPAASDTPGQQIITVGSFHSGWSSWSQAQKVGVISGPLLFVLITIGLLWHCQRRRKEWLVQGRPEVNVVYHSGWGWR